MEKYREIEKSIIKKYRKEIWSKFIKGIKEYQLISPSDKVAVCLSGGKDSMLLAKCMQELKRHGQMEFEVKFILMNPGYSEEHMELIKKNIEMLNIPIHIFETEIFKVVNKVAEGSPCYLCARMRRGYLYDQAQKLGCNKIALGHHFDDVIETILLNMLYGGEIKTMMPKVHSDNFKGLELIRPLYLVEEKDIIHWGKHNQLEFLNCACAFTEDEISDSKRLEMKKLIKQFEKTNPYIKINIFRSVENINLNAVVGYRKDKQQYNFLDDYDKQG